MKTTELLNWLEERNLSFVYEDGIINVSYIAATRTDQQRIWFESYDFHPHSVMGEVSDIEVIEKMLEYVNTPIKERR